MGRAVLRVGASRISPSLMYCLAVLTLIPSASATAPISTMPEVAARAPECRTHPARAACGAG